MKKIILLLAFCLSVGNLFAQDANADKLREEGDAAMTAKNYPEVVAKYSEYLKLTNYEDESRIFNCAFAAYNAKKYDDAIKFYDMAIQKGYKAEELFKDVLVVSNAKYKGNALYSLGVMFYNAGAKILADANPIATSDPDKYAAEKKKADAQMAKAKGYLEQAVALNAADANSKKILDAINAAAK